MTAALFHPVTLVLALMCIQWATLSSIGPFTLRLPYVLLGLIIVYALASRRRMAGCMLFVRQNLFWIAPFALYLLLLTAALYGSPGQNIAPREIFYLLASIAFAGSLAVARDIPLIIRLGAALAVLLFIVIVEILAQTLGLSWSDAIIQYLRSGDLRFVVVSFFREVFNAQNPSGDVTFVASLKNGIAVCVLVAGLMFRSSSAQSSRDFTGVAFMGLVLLLLFLLNTRSVIIAAGMSILLAIALGAAIRPSHLPTLIMKGFAVVAVLVLAIGYMEPPTAAPDALSERFAFEDQSTASRMQQYNVALERIQKHPFTGSGYFEIGGYPVHNLFLSAWMHAGLAAFLLVTFFYVAVLARWLAFLRTVARSPGYWVLPLSVEWVAPLPILPLFRVWLSGGGGHPAMGEWIAIAAFFGLLLANDLRRRQAAASRPVAKASPRPLPRAYVRSRA